MKEWERGVLDEPHAAERVAEIEDELRLAAGLTALRERAGLTQRELAERLRVSQPRVVAIERSRNVTVSVLEQYVAAVGGQLELTVSAGGKRFNLLSPRAANKPAAKASARKVLAARASADRGAAAKVAPLKTTAGTSSRSAAVATKAAAKTPRPR
jgi:transcriptional regulator with XRE-family HTH domain